MRRIGALLLGGLCGCGPRPPGLGLGISPATPATLAPLAAEAPSARAREQFLRAQVAWAQGELHEASHGLARASYEDPGSGAISVAWAEAALRAGDQEQLRSATAKLRATAPAGGAGLAAGALWAVGSGSAPEPTLRATLDAWPSGSPPDPSAALLLWRSFGPAAGATGPALARRLDAEGVPLDCVPLARVHAAASAPAAAVQTLRACAGSLPAEALPEALRLLVALRTPTDAAPLALLLSDRLWVEHPAPPPDVAQISVQLAKAVVDPARARCWSALAARAATPAEVGAPGYVAGALWGDVVQEPLLGPQADPALTRWLGQRAARWARC